MLVASLLASCLIYSSSRVSHRTLPSFQHSCVESSRRPGCDVCVAEANAAFMCCRISQHAQQEARLLMSEVWHVASSKQTERRHHGQSSGELQGWNRLYFDFHLKNMCRSLLALSLTGR